MGVRRKRRPQDRKARRIATLLLALAVCLYGRLTVCGGMPADGQTAACDHGLTGEYVLCPVDGQGQGARSAAAAGIRRTAPRPDENGSRYYYDQKANPFYPRLAPGYKRRDGYVTGNCTWYAWGRACEIAGQRLPHPLRGDAGSWWEENRREAWYAAGSEPRRGAIICYATHVAVVERAEPLIVSESGWATAKEKGSIVFHCGSPWRQGEKVLGYIYPDRPASADSGQPAFGAPD